VWGDRALGRVFGLPKADLSVASRFPGVDLGLHLHGWWRQLHGPNALWGSAVTEHELLNFLAVQCRQDATVHQDHLRRLFRMAGEAYAFLDESEWWSTAPEVIEPLIERAREFLMMHREEARAAYRAAWHRRNMSIALERSRLERELDRLRLIISDGPEDPKWIHFVSTLPGLRIVRTRRPWLVRSARIPFDPWRV
jgi:hypothetical protein